VPLNGIVFNGLLNKMLTSQVFKSRVGLHYTLRLAGKGFSALPISVKSETFTDKNTAFHFVMNLQVPLFFWENFAQGNSFFSYSNWKNTNPHATIEHYIAQALMQGSVQAYKTASVSELNESRQLRSFKDADGKKFELQPATSVLANMAVDAKSVRSEASAAQIIQDLGITAESAQSINKSFNLPAGNTGSVETLKAALISGDVVLTQKPEALKPPSGGEFVEAVIESKAAEAPPPAKAESKAPDKKATEPVLDEKATAEVMTQAAEDGTPFCEECEKENDEKAA